MGASKNQLWVWMCDSQHGKRSYYLESVLFLNFWLIPMYLSANMRVVVYDKKLNIF